MTPAEISIIIPMRDLEHEIGGILRSVAAQVTNRRVEFIVVDMGSADKSVIEALGLIKEQKLRGCVVQNGRDKFPTSLNTGIYKSSGEYVTFLFPRRLYRDFIDGYYETALQSRADFIYGSTSEEEAFSRQKGESARPGMDVFLDLINGKTNIDIGAMMVKRNFLIQENIRFTEECQFGFAEEFVLRILLCSHSVQQSKTVMQRDRVFGLNKNPKEKAGYTCFERIEAMRRVYDLLRSRHPENKNLRDRFMYQKLPDTVLCCVDILLSEGAGYNAVRGALKVKGYDDYLKTGKATDMALKKQVSTWRYLPWMYKPRTK